MRRKIGWNALIQITLLCFGLTCQAQIAHLELGAANYGIQYGTSEKQFLVLENTMRDLIKEFGPAGIIYLNDIDENGLKMAQEWATAWLRQHSYNDIRIESIPGDYATVKIPEGIKTAHLTHPDSKQLPERFGPRQRTTAIVEALERIAEHSEMGLKITTYYNHPTDRIWNLPHLLQRSEFVATEISGYEYYRGNGVRPKDEFTELSERPNQVFLIMPKTKCHVSMGELAASTR